MLSPLVLLQSDGAGQLAGDGVDTTLIIMLGVISLITLVVLGLRFLRNLFEIITATTASLRYHGQSDHFFFSLMVVFLGGLIGTIILFTTTPAIVGAWSGYSRTVSEDLMRGNPNRIYHEIVRTEAETRINNSFDVFFLQSLIIMPMVFIGGWLFFGTLGFLFSKVFGGHVTWVDMHGTIAYSAFFWAIGLCLALPMILGFVASMVGGPQPEFGVGVIAGVVLLLYALVLFLIGIAQAGELTAGQTVGVLIAFAVILFGIYYGVNHQGKERFDLFRSAIQSFNPAHQQI